jgi:hypothetical protein
MTIEGWMKEYQRRTGETVEFTPDNTVFNESKGFLQYAITDNFKGKRAFLINAVCGDGLFWEEFAQKAAKLCLCEVVITTTFRNPKAYKRRFKKAELIGYVFQEKVR